MAIVCEPIQWKPLLLLTLFTAVCVGLIMMTMMLAQSGDEGTRGMSKDSDDLDFLHMNRVARRHGREAKASE